MISLLLAAALSLPAAAAEPAKVTCPDGHPPVLTGHPFSPLSCPSGGKEPTLPEVTVSTAMAPLGSRGGSLASLDGRWEGLVYFAGRRFECSLEVSGGGTRGVWEAMDYASHLGHSMEGVLHKPGWFSRGVPKLEVTVPHAPGEKLTARVWLAPGVAAWKYDGREEVHRVEYAVSGDRLLGRWVLFRAEGPVTATTFELTRRK